MFKLGHYRGGEWVEHSHPPVFKHMHSASGTEKVLAAAPGGDTVVIRTLLTCLNSPVLLLYVLHTPRGEGRPGRYQSPELTPRQADDFLRRFSDFLSSDARFDLWLHSPADQATIVWDRHNLVHGYGPTAALTEAFLSLGFYEGDPMVPAPHEHHYHAAFDEDARKVLSSMPWSYSPLQPDDEQ